MARKFSSFLIRWWRSEESQRLEIEHIQSGQKQLTSSVEDAVAWLSEQQADGTDSASTAWNDRSVSPADSRDTDHE